MTTRIRQLPLAALAALADGDLARAQAVASIPLSPWLAAQENRALWHRRAEQVRADPDDLAWVTGVLWDDVAGRTVGRGGFHAAPDERGMVELGYVVDPAHRRRGHARSALEGAIVRVRAEPGVTVLRLTISPDNTASLALAATHPFVRVGEQWDDEDGLEVIFEMAVGP